MAFGGGALLFASLVDLFGNALQEIEHHGTTHIYVMSATAIFGCALFEALNSVLRKQGGLYEWISSLQKAPRIDHATIESEDEGGSFQEGLLDGSDGEICALPIQCPKRAKSESMDAYAVRLEDTQRSMTADSQEAMTDEAQIESSFQAAKSIWLGILIDGFPESIVIGSLVVSEKGIQISFVVGVFLANLPEAMSAAVAMQKGGMSHCLIYAMWSSIMLITGLGALFAAAIFPEDMSNDWRLSLAAIEGLAGGAMLTVIAETMLPEAFHESGNYAGVACLLGFLTTFVVAAQDHDVTHGTP
jgi:zinc transporter ZupT